ncbi:MAG: hypothetical protein K9N09_03050 [Candidatus Cloacimonetes bacterium]|nr:hypothetical protein [Candidatus Cloacimonadota bacterium]MCF7814817.1 hypothetical protein [Candidatus Cloacimonadota bacterium]MCF7867653.1 hypothetical protein [Candidatus Cloacimonadota bacterium]MCF7883549.1 hypothetical protein [Candidatus Cloacimonadota bacterium]
MKKSILILFVLLPVLLWPQYNEKNILIKQANRYLVQRHYERANQIYEQILTDFPVDAGVVDMYVSNLIRTSKIDKAEEQLNKYAQQITDLIRIKLRTSILISQGKLDKAEELCLDFLAQNAGSINSYRTLSSIFEQFRQYEIAVNILLQARKVTKDDHLYSREMALDYQNLKEYEKSVEEFFKLVSRQKGYTNYALSRLKQMLQDDDSLISKLEKESSKYEDENIIQIVAQCYAEIKDYDNALLKYEKLAPNILNNFAISMKSMGNLEVAKRAFVRYVEREHDVAKQATANMQIADILITLGDLETAEKRLLKIYNDKNLQGSHYRFRTKANSDARLLLSEIAIIRNDDSNKIVNFLEDAKKYSYNLSQKNDIEYKIIEYLMLIGNFEDSKYRLQALLSQQESGTDSYKMGFYYSYLLALMQNDPASDSLLGEILINLPEKEQANDALNLFVVSSLLKPEQKSSFFAAYRQMQLHKIEAAVDSLLLIFQETNNEEMLLLAGEWAELGNLTDDANYVFSQEFKNPILQNYARLKLAELHDDKELCRTFLQNNPQSIFSPGFRKILEN